MTADNSNVERLEERANVLIDLGRPGAAIPLLQRALARCPGNARMLVVSVIFFGSMGAAMWSALWLRDVGHLAASGFRPRAQSPGLCFSPSGSFRFCAFWEPFDGARGLGPESHQRPGEQELPPRRR